MRRVARAEVKVACNVESGGEESMHLENRVVDATLAVLVKLVSVHVTGLEQKALRVPCAAIIVGINAAAEA